MSGMPTPLHTAVLEPGVITYSANHSYKQLARIFRHLRDELHEQNPRLAKPTSSMIEHLVFNCPLALLQNEDWQQVIEDVLRYLMKQLHPAYYRDELFIRVDSNQALFPNEELFDPQDAYLFSKALLEQHHQNFFN